MAEFRPPAIPQLERQKPRLTRSDTGLYVEIAAGISEKCQKKSTDLPKPVRRDTTQVDEGQRSKQVG
jgi:hypothetical protein